MEIYGQSVSTRPRAAYPPLASCCAFPGPPSSSLAPFPYHLCLSCSQVLPTLLPLSISITSKNSTQVSIIPHLEHCINILSDLQIQSSTPSPAYVFLAPLPILTHLDASPHPCACNYHPSSLSPGDQDLYEGRDHVLFSSASPIFTSGAKAVLNGIKGLCP